MPDASKNGNANTASNSKNSSVAGVSSEIERQQQAAAAYDDSLRRSASSVADLSSHSEVTSSSYSVGAGAVGAVNTVPAYTQAASLGAYSAGAGGFGQPTSGPVQATDAMASQQATPGVATQPIQQVPSAFASRMEQQDSVTPFAGASERSAFAQRSMMTSTDGIDAAGIAGSRDFIEGNAVSVQADARDAFSSAFDAGRTGFGQLGGGLGQGSGTAQAGQQSFGDASPMAAPSAPAEDKAGVVSEAVGFSPHQGPSSSWASADMFGGGKAGEVHLNKKMQEKLDNSKAAYVQAKQDFASAEKSALETLDSSGWSSGNQVSGLSDSATRVEGFKGDLGTSADSVARAVVSSSRDFGFSTSDSSATAAPDSVRSAARKVIAEKKEVRAASDEMIAAHQEASEFLTKAEQRAKTAANFKSAATNALVNSAVASIGDDSVAGATIRSSTRAALAAHRSIKASKAARKAGGARGFFSSSAEAAKSAVFAFDEEGSLDGLEKADEAVRTGRYIRGKAKDFEAARAKSKGGSKSQLMSQAEKKAARTAEEGQRAAFSKSMQRRSMSIAKAKTAAGEASSGASLLQRLGNALTSIGSKIASALISAVQSILSAISSAASALIAAIGAGGIAILAVILIAALIVVLFGGGGSMKKVEGLNETETQVAEFFREKGLPDLQIAAIMGNMYAESGMNPGSEEGGGTNANGIGLCQWTNGRHTNLVNYAKSVGKSWTEVQVQLDFFWDHDSWGYWSRSYTIRPEHGPNGADSRSLDPVGGTLVSGSKRAFLASTDLKDAVRQFCYGWEGAGIPRLKVRYEAADRYYEALTNPSDGDGDHGAGTGAPQIAGASARQQGIVNSAYATPSPGQGLCAAWVSNVFRNAGYGFYGGNACDMCRSWCHSSNRNELKVGMIIADVSHPGTGSAGLTYGHVGIYIGSNKVMSNEGPITVKSLDRFISFYGAGTGCKWGWLGGIDLSK